MTKLKIKKILLGAAMIAIMGAIQLVGTTAHAAGFVITDPIYSIDDVYIGATGSSQNNAQLRVNNVFNSYLKFDLTDLNNYLNLNNLVVTQAVLQLQGSIPSANLKEIKPSNSLSLYSASTAWSELTPFTNSNLPASGSSVLGSQTLTNVPVNTAVQYNINLSNFDFNTLNTNNEIAFLLSRSLGNNVTTIFSSRTNIGAPGVQSSNGPRLLVLETAIAPPHPVPEPASLMLLGISSIAGFLGLKRKK